MQHTIRMRVAWLNSNRERYNHMNEGDEQTVLESGEALWHGLYQMV